MNNKEKPNSAIPSRVPDFGFAVRTRVRLFAEKTHATHQGDAGHPSRTQKNSEASQPQRIATGERDSASICHAIRPRLEWSSVFGRAGLTDGRSADRFDQFRQHQPKEHPPKEYATAAATVVRAALEVPAVGLDQGSPGWPMRSMQRLASSNRQFSSLRLILLVTAFGLASLCLPVDSFASASILGFSMGEENITLSGILAQAVQQVQFLSNIAAVTRDVKADVGFVKDVYETGNDLVSGRWQVVADEFLGDILASDANLREIFQNTEQIVTNQVPRGNAFRRLVDAGLEDAMFQAFGPYPFGRQADMAGLLDLSAINLDKLAGQQMAKWKQEHSAIEQAIRECATQESPEACKGAANRMQIQQTEQVEQLKSIEAQRAKAEAMQMATHSGDRKEHVIAAQKDVTDLMEAMQSMATDNRVLQGGK